MGYSGEYESSDNDIFQVYQALLAEDEALLAAEDARRRRRGSYPAAEAECAYCFMEYQYQADGLGGRASQWCSDRCAGLGSVEALAGKPKKELEELPEVTWAEWEV